MFYDDGLYLHNFACVIVLNGQARHYSFNYAGDFGEWECSTPYREYPEEVALYPSLSEMFAGVAGYKWLPDERDIEFFPSEELPFDDFPPIDDDKPWLNVTTYETACPLLAWAYDMEIIHR